MKRIVLGGRPCPRSEDANGAVHRAYPKGSRRTERRVREGRGEPSHPKSRYARLFSLCRGANHERVVGSRHRSGRRTPRAGRRVRGPTKRIQGPNESDAAPWVGARGPRSNSVVVSSSASRPKRRPNRGYRTLRAVRDGHLCTAEPSWTGRRWDVEARRVLAAWPRPRDGVRGGRSATWAARSRESASRATAGRVEDLRPITPAVWRRRQQTSVAERRSASGGRGARHHQGPSLPMASTGQLSIASLHWAISSADSGCL